jgi:hypothetical protein
MNEATINATGQLLCGSGLTIVATDLNTGLLLIGVGVVLQVLVAVLNKFGIPVRGE